jgi:hypothetical protein
MLDIASYRMGEAAAKRQITTWRFSQIHHVEHFEKTGFPVRLNSIAELGQIMDSMQDNRFEPYMEELGGLSQDELALVVDAAADAVDLQLTYLPQTKPVIPLATLMSAFIIYKNLTSYKSDLASVLEIGPGCGYLSFFLKRLSSLRDYSQIEACESFYILQNLVNIHSFGKRFLDTAFPEFAETAVQCFASDRHHIERSFYLQQFERDPVSTHYPWWRIGEILNTGKRYDVITSNANLLEFNPWALDDYLTLIEHSLAPAGILYVQCTGYPAYNWTMDTLFDVLSKRKLALLFYTDEAASIDYYATTNPSRGGLLSKFTSVNKPARPRKFTRNVMILIGETHPLYGKYAGPENYRRPQIPREEVIERMLFAPLAEGSRKIYSKATVAEMVSDRFRYQR